MNVFIQRTQKERFTARPSCFFYMHWKWMVTKQFMHNFLVNNGLSPSLHNPIVWIWKTWNIMQKSYRLLSRSFEAWQPLVTIHFRCMKEHIFDTLLNLYCNKKSTENARKIWFRRIICLDIASVHVIMGVGWASQGLTTHLKDMRIVP